MLPFLIYEGKVAVALAVFYMFYRLLLKKETFHRLNRVVLVGMVVASFLLPLCVITIHKPMEMAPEVYVEQLELGGAVSAPAQAWWPTALAILYFAGVAFVLGRVIVSILSIVRIVRQGQLIREEDGCKIIVTEREIDPFSWMRDIVLQRKDWEGQHDSIITHEKAHIAYGHSAELLLVDILSAFQWFNPAIWMLRMDLQELHEYEADDAVLRSGANLKDYQYLLIRKAVSKSGYSVANSFNHSILKNRITMMSKTKSPLMRGLRVLWLIPLMCMCVGLQTQTVYEGPHSFQLEQVTLNLHSDGRVYIDDSTYGFEIGRIGGYIRGTIGNRVYPEVNIQVQASPDAPAGSTDRLREELRKNGLLRINWVRHE